MFYLFDTQYSSYTAILGSVIVASVTLVVVSAPREKRREAFDLCLVALLAALLLARAEHVLLRWDYYADHLDQALDLRRGGLGWHGALWGALVGMWVYRGDPVRLPYDALAFALPLLTAAAWLGCAAAGCAYGAEVRTLADYPPQVTAELRDIYGIAAPRWNTPLYGVALAGILGMVAALVRIAAPARAALAFWAGLAVLALGMYGIGYARADAVVHIAGIRGDQALDVLTLIAAVTMVIVHRRRFG